MSDNHHPNQSGRQLAENLFPEDQIKSSEYTNKYISNWKNYYEEKNFEGMDREYKKIKKELKNLIPIEKTINEARTIENIHTLIKNNGQNFDLPKEVFELAEKLK